MERLLQNMQAKAENHVFDLLPARSRMLQQQPS